MAVVLASLSNCGRDEAGAPTVPQFRVLLYRERERERERCLPLQSLHPLSLSSCSSSILSVKREMFTVYDYTRCGQSTAPWSIKTKL